MEQPLKSNIKLVIGIDEAGRGCWAGPVVAAAVATNHFAPPPQKILSCLRDSKKLSSRQRRNVFQLILKEARKINPQIAFGIGIADNHTIDQLNIRQATKIAMQRSLNELYHRIDCRYIHTILVDGRDNFQFEGLPKSPIYIVKGDDKIPQIQAASIIAKVVRDQIMENFANIYPEYKFERHKGYGTELHRQVLSHKSKITTLHRISFKPIQKLQESKPKFLRRTN